MLVVQEPQEMESINKRKIIYDDEDENDTKKRKIFCDVNDDDKALENSSRINKLITLDIWNAYYEIDERFRATSEAILFDLNRNDESEIKENFESRLYETALKHFTKELIDHMDNNYNDYMTHFYGSPPYCEACGCPPGSECKDGICKYNDSCYLCICSFCGTRKYKRQCDCENESLIGPEYFEE